MSLIPPKGHPLILLLVIFHLLVASQPKRILIEDHKTLIFQHCSTRKLDDPNGMYTSARTRLLQKLVSQSSRSKSNRSFVMVGDRFAASLSGLFQCRGDLDDRKCKECMEAIRNSSNDLCGNSMAARIQFSGCHVQFEADKFDEVSTPNEGDHQVKHKSCGEPQAVVSSEYFEQMRSQAFDALETEVSQEDNTIGFYSINHEGIHAMAQCEVGIGACECGKCVGEAAHIVEEECESSVSGQVYLDLCFLSYEFNPHGTHEKKGTIGGSGKLVAIAVGGVALLAITFMLLRFCKRKKDDDF